MEVTHLNHSSIICEIEKEVLLTDPWLFSNAFQGWSQYPGPNIETLKKLIEEKKLSTIVLSHAHDDHVDDIFLSYIKQKVNIVIPKTLNSGFKNRIIKSGISVEQIIQIDEEGLQVGDFTITAINNKSLTDEDFIILISNKQNLIIHANDNWHEFTRETVEKIKNFINKKNLLNINILSQVGIADSYPLFYKNITNKTKKYILSEKIKNMCNSLLKNCKLIGIDKAYAYANQSKFSDMRVSTNNNFDPYKIRDDIIKTYEPFIRQLLPSDKIKDGKLIRFQKNYQTVLEYRLNLLEQLFYNYANKKPGEFLPIRFKSIDSSNNLENEITLYAPDTVWNDILNGNLNLEAIITGGLGLIEKPKNYNMKKEYLLLCKWAYINQIKSKKDLTINF